MLPGRLPLVVAASVLTLAACGGGAEVAELADVAGGEPPAAASPTTSPAPSDTVATTLAPSVTGQAAVDEPTTGDTTASPEVAVPAALDFTAPLLGGGDIEMGQFAGRPVLLWFWAPW